MQGTLLYITAVNVIIYYFCVELIGKLYMSWPTEQGVCSERRP